MKICIHRFWKVWLFASFCNRKHGQKQSNLNKPYELDINIRLIRGSSHSTLSYISLSLNKREFYRTDKLARVILFYDTSQMDTQTEVRLSLFIFWMFSEIHKSFRRVQIERRIMEKSTHKKSNPYSISFGEHINTIEEQAVILHILLLELVEKYHNKNTFRLFLDLLLNP